MKYVKKKRSVYVYDITSCDEQTRFYRTRNTLLSIYFVENVIVTSISVLVLVRVLIMRSAPGIPFEMCGGHARQRQRAQRLSSNSALHWMVAVSAISSHNNIIYYTKCAVSIRNALRLCIRMCLFQCAVNVKLQQITAKAARIVGKYLMFMLGKYDVVMSDMTDKNAKVFSCTLNNSKTWLLIKVIANLSAETSNIPVFFTYSTLTDWIGWNNMEVFLKPPQLIMHYIFVLYTYHMQHTWQVEFKR